MDYKSIESRFNHHDLDEDKKIRILNIRNAAKQLAYIIVNVCPEGREMSLSLTKLEDSLMWANASVARMDEWADQYKEGDK